MLLDRSYHDRVADFGIARSLNDTHSDITVTNMQTENVLLEMLRRTSTIPQKLSVHLENPELEEVRHTTETIQTLEEERSVGPLVETEVVEKECCIWLKTEEVGKLLTPVSYGHRYVCVECSTLLSRTYLSGMSNGVQTGDPCVRLTFPHTGLTGEGSVGNRIVMIQFRFNSN